MAHNLVKAGFQVHGFDLSDAARERAAQNGVVLFDTVKEAVQGRARQF